ncbi:MAG: HD domain-containing protein [Candidatus Doudnabacteria bacterium]|nr:HD domain-containing protein [Candidatus Doudnabacteria bacterium]
MKNLPDLFRLLELTRTQPQYGYALSDVKSYELSNLAEHHYLVTMIAWQLARHIKNQGGVIDIQKVLEYALIHDLGELFGGDISRIYVELNKRARVKAKAFEEENHKFIGKFFGEDEKYFRKLAKEMLDPKTDEAWIFKMADYMECGHFLRYSGHYKNDDDDILGKALPKMISKIRNKHTKKVIKELTDYWLKEISKDKSSIDVLKRAGKK